MWSFDLSVPVILAEVAAHASRWQQFAGTFWDFGHMTTEIAVTILFDGVVGMGLWPLAKFVVRRHDRLSHQSTTEVTP